MNYYNKYFEIDFTRQQEIAYNRAIAERNEKSWPIPSWLHINSSPWSKK